MPSGLRPLHPIHTPTAASARHRAPPTLCALCTYGARRALRTCAAPPPPGSATAASDVAICVAPFSDEQWEALEALSAAARHIRMQPWRLGLRPWPCGSSPEASLPAQACSPSGGGRCPSRGPRGENPCRVAAQEKKRALWRGALWWLPDDARSIFGPPGAGKCMVVVVNGLLSNGRLPHAYYYKRPALSRGRTIRAGVRARGSPTCSRPLSRLHA